MRFLVTVSFLLVTLVLHASTAEEWSWGSDKTKTKEPKTKPSDSIAATDREAKSIDSYSAANDGSSQEAEISSSNVTDTHPRHLIRDRLCGLGLMEVTYLTKLMEISKDKYYVELSISQGQSYNM